MAPGAAQAQAGPRGRLRLRGSSLKDQPSTAPGASQQPPPPTSLLFITTLHTRPTSSMAYPWVTRLRDTLVTNITNAPVGKARRRSKTIPRPDVTYGTPSERNKNGGVAEALSSVDVQPTSETLRPPNFVDLNRDAVKAGLSTWKDMKKYRVQKQDAAVRKVHVPRERGRALPPPPPDIVFGIASRPSTPIAGVLSHEYGRRWLEEHLRTSSHKRVQMKLTQTRTSLLRRRRSPSLPAVQKPFKLPQITEVASVLDTFRDPAARERAFRARQSTSLSRTEHQGPGTNGQD
ncbi:cilia- and flagella-associated protein 77-like [Cololabis saira]|uniref:cilia- and flagella-associated protein 77-like n=1 Tax=Cololabis saira TaxID=129043 RepID=UPI002AD21E85|nr:cilia- and flagella-associated protein 77-like [Cololabis saira]